MVAVTAVTEAQADRDSQERLALMGKEREAAGAAATVAPEELVRQVATLVLVFHITEVEAEAEVMDRAELAVLAEHNLSGGQVALPLAAEEQANIAAVQQHTPVATAVVASALLLIGHTRPHGMRSNYESISNRE